MFLYAVRSGNGGPIKIGISWNPFRRARGLGLISPMILMVREYNDEADAKYSERSLLERFGPFRWRGPLPACAGVHTKGTEWFAPHKSLLDYIRNSSQGVWLYFSKTDHQKGFWRSSSNG